MRIFTHLIGCVQAELWSGMGLFKFILVISCAVEFRARCLENLRLRIESNTIEPCSHIKNGKLISNNSRVDLSQGQYDSRRFGVSRISRLELIDANGHTKDLSLPGCFNVRVDAIFTQDIQNPYIETYVKTDREEPCRKFKPNPYCQPTDNVHVRAVTGNQGTCRFCDLCVAPQEASQLKNGNEVGTIQVTSSACSAEPVRRLQAGRSYPFEITGICTPSSNELERQMNQKFGPNWHEVDFIRRGSIIMTVHILERRNPPPKPCLQHGAGAYEWKGPPQLKKRVMENLENTCKRYREPAQQAPKDDYLGCYNAYINYAIDRLQ